jgi:pimeloyl-ACP methyl ester carboxylesterase
MGRPTLILLHGLLCDASVWKHQVAALKPEWDIRVPSLRGYDSFGSMAEAVLAGAPKRFALAGHSMGARVALEVLAEARERIDRLALLDTGVHGVREGEAEGRQSLLDLAESDGMTAVAHAWAPPMVHPARRDDPSLMDPIYNMVASYRPEEFRGQVRALLDRRDATALLPSIACPTLVLCGCEDSWSPPDQHREIAAAIPGAQLQLIEDCGHMAPLECPDAVSDALRSWLAAPAATGTDA